jgi:hypothetical protein
MDALVTIIDPLGHVTLMREGYDYQFLRGPEALHQGGEARRALFQQFQGYPANSVQGAGQLVRNERNGIPCEPWRLTQPPQVVQHHVPIVADLLGGGFEAGQNTFQPLINTNP